MVLFDTETRNVINLYSLQIVIVRERLIVKGDSP